MKSSFVVATLAASVAVATPLEKRWLVTEWDIATVTLTVTGSPPASTETGGWNWGGWRHSDAAPTTTSTEVAAAPTSEAPAWTSQAAPATTEAPAASSASSDWAASTSTVASSYAQAILNAHNNHRMNASVPGLTWSDNMASIAQQIASSCVYAHNTDAGGGGYGQNIGAGAPDDQVPGMINNEMYNGEINYYPGYGSEPDMSNFENWGHYSQIVWKSTTSVGCYTQYCPGGLANTGGGVSPYFTVCNYSPPGNFGGEYAANVLKPGNMPSVTL